MEEIKRLLMQKYNKPIIDTPALSLWDTSNTIISLIYGPNQLSESYDNEHEIKLQYADKKHFMESLHITNINQWLKSEKSKIKL